MSIFEEPKVDCHNHVFDPARFPYAPDATYAPSGQEMGTAAQLLAVFDAYGVQNALVVGPNSGYGADSRCLLDVLERGNGRLKGAAVVPKDVSRHELRDLRDAGIVGITVNVAALGVDYYAGIAGLLADLAALDMFVDLQVERDQLVPVRPLLLRSGVRILVDHCGRPNPEAGVDQPGFRALLDLAGTGRVTVKLLRAPERIDFGPLLTLVEQLVPRPADRRALLWDTPRRLFGFGLTSGGDRPD